MRAFVIVRQYAFSKKDATMRSQPRVAGQPKNYKSKWLACYAGEFGGDVVL